MMLECQNVAAARMAAANLALLKGALDRFVVEANALADSELGKNLLEHDEPKYVEATAMVTEACDEFRRLAKRWTKKGDELGEIVEHAGEVS